MPYTYNKPWTKKAAYSKTQENKTSDKNSTSSSWPTDLKESEAAIADILARLTDLEDRMVDIEQDLDELMENAGEWFYI